MPRIEREISPRDAPTTWPRAVLMVAMFVLFAPVSFWSANAPRGAVPGPILIAGTVFAVIAILIMFLVSRLVGLGRGAAIAVVISIVLSNWHPAGRSLAGISALDWLSGDLAALAILLILFAGAWRYGSSPLFHTAVLMMAVVMMLTPLPGLLIWYLGGDEPAPLSSTQGIDRLPAEGDVYLIILDGYGRGDVLAALYDYELDSSGIEQHGFKVIPDARTGYSSTVASLASILSMGDIGVVGLRPSDRERVALHSVIGGDNPVVDSFRNAGFRYVHIESGWDGSRCGEAVDECFEDSFVDESIGIILEKTILGLPFQQRYGSAFTTNGLRALDDLEEVASANGPDRRLVLAHVTLPHPPMFLDSSCEIRFDTGLSGGALGNPGVDEDVLSRRKAAYLDQIECVNDRLADVVGMLDPNDSVIITGDHGPDSFGQLSLDSNDWSADAIWERMSVYTAVRFPGCTARLPETLILRDVFPLLSACSGGGGLMMGASSMRTYPVDASPGVVTELDYVDRGDR